MCFHYIGGVVLSGHVAKTFNALARATSGVMQWLTLNSFSPTHLTMTN